MSEPKTIPCQFAGFVKKPKDLVAPKPGSPLSKHGDFFIYVISIVSILEVKDNNTPKYVCSAIFTCPGNKYTEPVFQERFLGEENHVIKFINLNKILFQDHETCCFSTGAVNSEKELEEVILQWKP